MKNKVLIFVLFFSVVFSANNVKAQVTASTAGGEASGSGGTVSYSVGQVFNTNQIGTNGSVTQGVQQSYEISVVNSLPESEGINLRLSVFPNPTTEYLILAAEGENYLRYTIQLYDINGNMVSTKNVSYPETKIDMISFKQATYILRVTYNDIVIKTFKIIKN